MKVAKSKFLSILFLNMIFSMAHADFAQNQVRYFSFADLTNHFKKLDSQDMYCYEKTKQYADVFGYSSPVNGKSLSPNPNYDFIGQYLLCLKGNGLSYNIGSVLTEQTTATIYNDQGDISEEKDETLEKIVEDLSEKFIGPEVVLVSYGLVKNQKEFNQIIKEAAIDNLKKNGLSSVSEYVKTCMILIHMRDEFLSY